MTLKIFIPKKVAVYLPLYIAKERRMFEGYLKTHNITKVEIIDPNKDEEGDICAIKKMHEENNNTTTKYNSIAIAIADPTSFLVSERITKKENIRVIGALINKPPFWAIDHKDEELSTIEDFNKAFDLVIHNDDNYATGSLIGKRVREKNEDIKCQTADYGSEIETMRKLYGDNNRIVAITTDIISIAKAVVNDRLRVNFSFAGDKSEFNYITTGILTSKKCCEKYPGILIDIIRVFKRTINDVYMEEGTVKLVLDEIAKDVFNCNITNTEHEAIYSLFNKGKFYDKDLIVSEKLWKNSITLQTEIHHSRYINEQEKQEKENLIKSSFTDYVDNRFARKANEKAKGIRWFFEKYRIRKKSTKSFVTAIFVYIILIAGFIGLNHFVLQLEHAWEFSYATVVIPAILMLIQKFGIDRQR